MPTRPPLFRPHGRATRAEQNREADGRRGSARQRGYTGRWDKASKTFIARHPLCRYCEVGAYGPARVAPASLTDHLYPHRTFDGVFWLTRLWVPCCTDCHAAKQATERKGRAALDALARRIGWPTLAEVAA